MIFMSVLLAILLVKALKIIAANFSFIRLNSNQIPKMLVIFNATLAENFSLSLKRVWLFQKKNNNLMIL